MDAKSQSLLEYPAVRARLAAYAAFAPSRRLAEALEPSSDPVIVARGLDETDEARAFLAGRPDVGIGGARDIGPGVERAARGGRLDPTELLAIAETLVAAARLADALRAVERPLLHELSRDIATLPPCGRASSSSIDPVGRDRSTSASPALGGLRRAVRIAYERLRARLDQLVHGELGAALQEPIITLRNGRYVVPVRADAKGKVRGIVHDQSGQRPDALRGAAHRGRAGQRLARGPAQGRRRRRSASSTSSRRWWRSTAAPLREHARRRSRVSTSGPPRRASPRSSTRSVPSPAKRAEVVLLSARHPGLSGRVVPIDVRLGDDYTALVITGPNTGGKTVALRTVGLLCLMHQSGLHIPAAAGSRLPVFRDVYRRHRRRAVRGPVALHVQRPPPLHRAHRGRGGAGRPGAARRAGRRHRPDGGIGAGAGAPRPLHPGRSAGHRHDPLRRAQGLRPRRRRRPATPRSSSTSRRSARPTG